MTDPIAQMIRMQGQKRQADKAKQTATHMMLDQTRPDDMAEGLRLSSEIGLPASVIASQPSAFRQQAEQKRNAQALADAPKTRAFLDDPVAAAIAKDDVGNLTFIERGLRDFGSSFEVIRDSEVGKGVQTGLTGVKQMATAAATIPMSNAVRNDMHLLEGFEKIRNMDPESARYEVAAEIGVSPQSMAAAVAFDFLRGDQDRRQYHVERITRRITSNEDVMNGLVEAVNAYSEHMQTTQGSTVNFTDIDDVRGFADWLAFNTGQSIPYMAVTALSAALGGTPGVAAAGYGMGVGDIQSGLIDEGITDQGGVALAGGVPYAAMELLGPAARPFRNVGGEVMQDVAEGYFQRLARDIPESAVEEFINEAGQEIIKDIAVSAGGGSDVVLDDETLLGWFNAGMAGAGSGAAMSPLSVAASSRKDAVAARNAGRTADRLRQIDEAVSASRLATRSPEKFREFADQIGMGAQEMFVPADGLREYFQAKDMNLEDGLEALEIDAQEFAEIEAAGGDVTISEAVYASKLSGTEDAAWFAENATFDPDEMSVSAADEFNSRVDEIMREAFEEAEAARKDDLESRAADQQIFDSVFSQLRGIGRSPDVARNEARVWSSFWRTMGERYGEDPLTLANWMGVQFRGPVQEQRRRSDLDIKLNTLRTLGDKALKPRGMGILDFVRHQGGVADRGGDVEAMDVPKGVIAESRSQIAERESLPTFGGMPSAGKGKGLDDLGRAMIEAGYFPEYMGGTEQADGTVVDEANIALEAIREAVSGNDRYVEGEGPDAELSALLDQMNERGIDLALSNDEIVAALEADSQQYSQIDLEDLISFADGVIEDSESTTVEGRLSEYPAQIPPEYEFSNYEEIGGKIYEMTPDQFLSMASELAVDEETDENVNDLASMMLGGRKIDPPRLSVGDDGRIDSHDGRHRALAAKRLGIEKMPVLLMGEGGGAFPSGVKTLKAQSGSRNRNATVGVTDTKSAEFREWFGDSQVVDENGDPRVVFHGSPEMFDAFDPDRAGGADQEGPGFYFTSDKDEADRYAVGGGRHGKSDATGPTLEVFLRIQNPIPLDGPIPEGDVERALLLSEGVQSRDGLQQKFDDDPDAFWESGLSNWSEDPISSFEALKASVMDAESPHDAFQTVWYDGFGGDNARYMAAMLEVGYDGVIIPNETKHAGNDHFIAFDPASIKSVHNRGTFDPNDARILYQDEAHPFEGMTRDEFLGSPKITSNANAASLVPKVLPSVEPVEVVRFDVGVGLTAKYHENGAAVLKGDKVIASYNLGDTLVVAKGHRRKGIAEELVYQWRMRFPDSKPATSRTKASQKLQEKVWDRIQSEIQNGQTSYNQEKRGSIILPRGGLTEDQTIINLFEGADLSTIMHESGHFFLEAFTTLANDQNAPQAMRDDLAAIHKFLGVKDGKYEVKHHEKWARGFEAYLMEGKAPSLELADSFARFKAWLTRIYRTALGLNVKLDNNVRDVMDRMLATDAEIAEARAEQSLTPLFTDKPAGMSATDWSTYQRMARRSEEQASQNLLKKTMAKVRREKQDWWKEERSAIESEVSREINAQPVYRMTEAMTNKQWIGDNEPDDLPDMRIDRQSLVDQFGEGVLAEVGKARLGGSRAIYTTSKAEEGMTPQEAAEFFGFENAGAMIESLQNAPRRKDLIAQETERRMVSRYGDVMNDGTIEEEALAAIHSEQQANTAAAEARHIARQMGRKTRDMTQRAYRQRAKSMLGRMSVSQASRPSQFLAAERRAARTAQEAFAAIARGGGEENLAKALQAKEQQILSGFLYNEAKKTAEMIEKRRVKMRSYDKKDVRKKLEGGYIEQIDSLLDAYDFRKRSPGQVQRAETLGAFIERMIEDGREAELNIDQRLLDETRRKHYSRLTVDEARGLFDTIDNLEHLGRFKQQLLDARRRRDLNETASVVESQIRKAKLKSPDQKSYGLQALNLIRRPDTILVALDRGEEMGPVYDALKRGIDEGQAEEAQRSNRMAERMDDLFRAHYDVKTLREMQKERQIVEGRQWSKAQIIALALNTGNENNYQRLMDPKVASDSLMNDQKLEALLSELDNNDWRFIQAMWDEVNSLWPDLAAVHKRRTGVTPNKVDAKLMVNAPSFVRGGYYPIKYDPSRGKKAAKDEETAWDRYVTAGHGATTQVANGMTKQREKTGGGRTLHFDLTVPMRHMRETIRYIALSESVDNAHKVLNHPLVFEAMQETGNADTAKTLDLWLQDTARGPIFNTDLLNTVSRMVKNNFTMSRLAFNMKTIALQATGLGQSAATIGKRNMLRGMMTYARYPQSSIEDVTARSSFMAERQTTFQKDIRDFMNEASIEGPLQGRYAKAKTALAKAGFWPIVKAQFLIVDVPTWLGAYSSGLEQFNGDDDKAVHYADRMVARAQDSGLFGDRAAVERGTVSKDTRQSDFIRLWTTLGGYMLTKLNRADVSTMQARLGLKEAETNAGRVVVAMNYATDLMLLFAFEAVVMGLAYAALTDEEDEEDLRKFMLQETGMAVIAGIPFVRDAASAFRGFGGGGLYGSVMEVPAKVMTQAAQGENDRALRRSIADLIGVTTGLPTTATSRILEGLIEPDETTPAEALFGTNPLAR